MPNFPILVVASHSDQLERNTVKTGKIPGAPNTAAQTYNGDIYAPPLYYETHPFLIAVFGQNKNTLVHYKDYSTLSAKLPY